MSNIYNNKTKVMPANNLQHCFYCPTHTYVCVPFAFSFAIRNASAAPTAFCAVALCVVRKLLIYMQMSAAAFCQHLYYSMCAALQT